MPAKKLHIAIVYFKIVNHNAIGRCSRMILEDLADEFDFTVFAVEFDNPHPDRIRWVKVPAPARPLFLLFLFFHFAFLFAYLKEILVRRRRFDIVQGIESTNLASNLCYAHFCHRCYLRQQKLFGKIRNARDLARWLDHKVHAALEPVVCRRAHRIIVPSRGLFRELSAAYPSSVHKIEVLPNPVDLPRYARPDPAACAAYRKELGIAETDFVIAFCALGHFERKGLALLINALREPGLERIKVLVIGGDAGATAPYIKMAAEANVASRISFRGPQTDTRPFLWASDCLTLPSTYEVFPLVVLEAAAASLPLLVTPLNGVEELLLHQVNGFLVEPREPARLADGMRYLMNLSPLDFQKMRDAARESVQRYGKADFSGEWQSVYLTFPGAS